jgi:hypothetical protein
MLSLKIDINILLSNLTVRSLVQIASRNKKYPFGHLYAIASILKYKFPVDAKRTAGQNALQELGDTTKGLSRATPDPKGLLGGWERWLQALTTSSILMLILS